MSLHVHHLDGYLLAWPLAKLLGVRLTQVKLVLQVHQHGCLRTAHGADFRPYQDASLLGPLIDRSRISLRVPAQRGIDSAAFIDNGGSTSSSITCRQTGATPLLAVLRCALVHEQGLDVEVPDDLVAYRHRQAAMRSLEEVGPVSLYAAQDRLVPDLDVIEGDIVHYAGADWFARVKRGNTVPLCPLIDGRPEVSYQAERRIDLQAEQVAHTGFNYFGRGGLEKGLPPGAEGAANSEPERSHVHR